MSVNIQNAFNSIGRTGPVPGLGGAFGEDGLPSASGEGRDFAALMRDMPAHEAAAPETRKRGESSSKAAQPSTKGKVDTQETDTPKATDHDGGTQRTEHTRKSADEKQDTKPDDTPAVEGVTKQAAVPVAAPIAASVSENIPADAKAEAKDERASVKAAAKTTPQPALVASSGTKAQVADDSEPMTAELATKAVGAQSKETKPVKAAAAKTIVSPVAEQPVTEANASDKKRAPKPVDSVHNDKTINDVKISAQNIEKDGVIDKKVTVHAQVEPVKAEAKTPSKPSAKAGEATALLEIADGKPQNKLQIPSDTPLTGFFGQRVAQSAQHAKTMADTTIKGQVAVSASTSGEAILTPQGKVAVGLELSVEQAPNPATIVARGAVVQAADARIPTPNRTIETAQVSALALVAAQSAENKAGEGADTAGGQRGDAAPLGSGVFGDGSAELGENIQSARFASRLDSAMSTAAVSSATAPGLTPATVTAPSSLNLGGALGQQVVDLGVSGQWINDIAREIATVSTNTGHGRFQIASQTMGAVRVEITPGAQGSNVLMTVDNEVAQAALIHDRQRLVQDAQLASIRIGDFRVDRVASLSQAQSGDMSNGQQSQNQSNSQNAQGASQSTSQNAMGQNTGQGGGQNSRQDMAGLADQGQNGGNPKAPFTRSVINDAETRDATLPTSGRGGDTARYA